MYTLSARTGFDRIHILRHINRLCTAAQFQFQSALVRSEHNAADPFIRISSAGTLAAVSCSATSRSLIVTKMSSAMKRFWCTHLLPVFTPSAEFFVEFAFISFCTFWKHQFLKETKVSKGKCRFHTICQQPLCTHSPAH